MRPLFLAMMLLAAALAGCIGSEDTDVDPSSTPEPSDLNPWQAGLADHHPTPDHVETRSADERRANVAPSGDPAFAAFDAAVVAWMAQHDIPAGQLALMKDGELRYTRGYGNSDRAGTEPANASTMFRIASVTKPMTAALVGLQVDEGLYNWTDPVFCLGDEPTPNCQLPIDPHPKRPVVDERLEDITVRHLINHTSGVPDAWEIYHSPRVFEVADTMGTTSPPPAWRVAQYAMGEPLDHAPGERYAYSNIGYILAGLVAEAATGTTLASLYDAYLFRPLGIQEDIEAGHILPEQRNPREPFYACDFGETENVYDPNETVCWADGGWSMAACLPACGLVATAEAVAAVYEAYAEYVPPQACGDTPCRGHTGGQPGTASGAGIIEDEGTVSQFVFLFNSREEGAHCDELGPMFQPIPILDCDVYDLYDAMFPLTLAWSWADDAAPGAGDLVTMAGHEAEAGGVAWVEIAEVPP